jgi:hypothetical protein
MKLPEPSRAWDRTGRTAAEELDHLADGHVIRYRRTDSPWSVVTMTVPNGVEAMRTQKLRLEALGHSIIDVTPSAPNAGRATSR